jgi:NAD(P)-dependent dehydrogenase (short-subunit alcohol dehydrogenase family)
MTPLITTPFGAYGQSKTANLLFAVEATRRWADDGIASNALMHRRPETTIAGVAPLCARPGQRRTAVGTLAEVDSMSHA